MARCGHLRHAVGSQAVAAIRWFLVLHERADRVRTIAVCTGPAPIGA